MLRALPGLGDLLCAVPTLRALRRAYPRATIHLLGLESTRSLVTRFGNYVDRLDAFPGYPGLPEQPVRPGAWERFAAGIRALHPRLALQLHGSGERTNEIVQALGAESVAGFHPAGAPCPDPARFLEWDDDESEVRRGLRLLQHIGLPGDDERLEFPLHPAARVTAETLVGAAGADRRPYAVIHPGANRAAARWGVDGFEAVAAALGRRGLRVVVTGGASERSLTAAVAAAAPGGIDLAGRTDIDELGWILAGSALLVANDTGVSHLAAALGVASVVVFVDPAVARPGRWAPLDVERHRAVPPSLERVVAEVDELLSRAEAAA